jgi:hypothetical protein
MPNASLEPQLPIYAALAFPDREVAAVALARVTREEPAFLGVAADEGLLPGVPRWTGSAGVTDAASFPTGRRCARCGPSASAKSRAR